MAIDVKFKKILFGNNVSHAHNKTRRKFRSNMHKHKIFLQESNSYITIKCPVSVLRSIEKMKKIC